MLIFYKSQKVNTKEEEDPTFRAQKRQKVTSTTCIDIGNKPKKPQSLCKQRA